MAPTSRSVRYGNRRALSAALANMANARRLSQSGLHRDYPGEACLSGSPSQSKDYELQNPVDEIAANDSTLNDEVESDDRNVGRLMASSTASHATPSDEAVKVGDEALVFVYGHNANLYAIFNIDEPESFDCETERQLLESYRMAISQLDLVVQCHPDDQHAAAIVCGYKTSYYIPPMMFIEIKYDALRRAYEILMNEAAREDYKECRREFVWAPESCTREGAASHSTWTNDQSQVSNACVSQASECASHASSRDNGQEKRGKDEVSINNSMHPRPAFSRGNSTNSRRYVMDRDSSMRRFSSGVSSRLDYSVSCDGDEYNDRSWSEDGSSLAYSYGGESLSNVSTDSEESRGSHKEEDRYHVTSPTPAKSDGLPHRSPTDPIEFERLIADSLPPDEYYSQLTNSEKLARHQLYDKGGLNHDKLTKPTIFDPFDLHENKADAPLLDTLPEEEMLDSGSADKQSIDMSAIIERNEEELVSEGFPDATVDGRGSVSDSQYESFATITLDSNGAGSSASNTRSKRGIKSKVRSIIKGGVSFSSGRRRRARPDPDGSVASSTACDSLGSKARDIDCFEGASIISQITDIDCYDEDHNQIENANAHYQSKQSCLEPDGKNLSSKINSSKIYEESVDAKESEIDDMMGIDTFTSATRPIKNESTAEELECLVDKREINALLAASSTFTMDDDATSVSRSVRFADEVDDAMSQVSTKSDGASIKSCLRHGKTYMRNDSVLAEQDALNEKALLDRIAADVEEERMKLLMTAELREELRNFDKEEEEYLNSRSVASSSRNRWNVLVGLDSCLDCLGSGLDNSLMSVENFCKGSKRASF